MVGGVGSIEMAAATVLGHAKCSSPSVPQLAGPGASRSSSQRSVLRLVASCRLNCATTSPAGSAADVVTAGAGMPGTPAAATGTRPASVEAVLLRLAAGERSSGVTASELPLGEPAWHVEAQRHGSRARIPSAGRRWDQGTSLPACPPDRSQSGGGSWQPPTHVPAPHLRPARRRPPTRSAV